MKVRLPPPKLMAPPPTKKPLQVPPPPLFIYEGRESTYVRRIIAKHRLQAKQFNLTKRATADLKRIIRIWAGKYFARITYAGSFVKGTAITGDTDIDLFLSLRQTIPDSLRDIYNGLAHTLKISGFSVRKQNVSIGIDLDDFKIDVVPGVRQPKSLTDHSIYRRKADTWTKTNINKHISFVTNSGRLNEILATKIWRKLHNIEFPSFYLELTVINALENRRKVVKYPSALSSNVLTVFQYLVRNFINAKVIDPEKSTNIVSDDLSDKEKKEIAKLALESLLAPSWDKIIW